MGLDTYDMNSPAGSDPINAGDNKIMELANKIGDSLESEHYLDGKHRVPNGSLGSRPAAGNVGRIYVVNDPVSGKVSLQFDNGASWVNIGFGTDTLEADSGLEDHKEQTIIDHPDQSVTEAKLASPCVTSVKLSPNAIQKKHLYSGHSDPTGSIKPLIDGSELDSSWHTHPSAGGGGGGSVTFLATKVTVASGTGTVGWTNKNLTGDIPATAIGVLLSGKVKFTLNNGFYESKSPRIAIRKDNSSDAVVLCGGDVVHELTPGGISELGFRGNPALFPVTTDLKIQYQVVDSNSAWEIELTGYIE